MTHRSPPIVVFFVDGMSPEIFRGLTFRSSRHFLSSYFSGAAVPQAVQSVFPSVTPPALSTILLGTFFHPEAPPNFAYYQNGRLRNLANPIDYFCVMRKLLRDSVFSDLQQKGKQVLMHRSNLPVPGVVKNRFGYRRGRHRLCRTLRKSPVFDVVWIEDHRIDWALHKWGHDSEEVLTAFEEFDALCEEVVDAIESKLGPEEYGAILFSDHGNEPTQNCFHFTRYMKACKPLSLNGFETNAERLVLANLLRRGSVPLRVPLLHTGAGGGQKTLYLTAENRDKHGRVPAAAAEHLAEDLLAVEVGGIPLVECVAFVRDEDAEEIEIELILEGRRGRVKGKRQMPNSAEIYLEGGVQPADTERFPELGFKLMNALRRPQGGDLVLTARPGICLDQLRLRKSIHGGIRKEQSTAMVSYRNLPRTSSHPSLAGILRPLWE